MRGQKYLINGKSGFRKKGNKEDNKKRNGLFLPGEIEDGNFVWFYELLLVLVYKML